MYQGLAVLIAAPAASLISPASDSTTRHLSSRGVFGCTYLLIIHLRFFLYFKLPLVWSVDAGIGVPPPWGVFLIVLELPVEACCTIGDLLLSLRVRSA